MPDDDETGYEGLGKLTDTDVDPDEVETPTEEELKELTVYELKEKYGPFASLSFAEDPAADDWSDVV